MTRPSRGAGLEVLIGAAVWSRAVPDVERVCRDAAVAAGGVARRQWSSANLALISDRRMRALNRDVRGLDRPTNVLAFPAGTSPRTGLSLGDIAIALETTRREARTQNKVLRDHLAHLVVHGVLHLLGYDHRSVVEAEAMERLERIALRRLGIANPYDERGVPKR